MDKDLFRLILLGLGVALVLVALTWDVREALAALAATVVSVVPNGYFAWRISRERAAARILAEKARQIESAGAELLLICTNTMHKVAGQVADAINIPLLHIADATALHARESGVSTVGLLGTRFTMEQAFYRGRLEQSGLTVLVPEAEDRDLVHRVIYEELCLGRTVPESRREFLRIIDALHEDGAEAVIEGCTEIGLLVSIRAARSRRT